MEFTVEQQLEVNLVHLQNARHLYGTDNAPINRSKLRMLPFQAPGQIAR
jgi:hypothetical protein